MILKRSTQIYKDILAEISDEDDESGEDNSGDEESEEESEDEESEEEESQEAVTSVSAHNPATTTAMDEEKSPIKDDGSKKDSCDGEDSATSDSKLSSPTAGASAKSSMAPPADKMPAPKITSSTKLKPKFKPAAVTPSASPSPSPSKLAAASAKGPTANSTKRPQSNQGGSAAKRNVPAKPKKGGFKVPLASPSASPGTSPAAKTKSKMKAKFAPPMKA